MLLFHIIANFFLLCNAIPIGIQYYWKPLQSEQKIGTMKSNETQIGKDEKMDVTSFGIDHNRLLRGIYVSRKDTVGDGILTTFDVRMKEPNREMVMDTSVMHTIEHLMATFFRAHPVWADKTIYVGPMGCRTGMYVIFKGDLESADVAEIMKDCYQYMADFDEESLPRSPKCAAITLTTTSASPESNVRNSWMRCFPASKRKIWSTPDKTADIFRT